MREYAQICLRKDGKSERRKVRFLCLCFKKIYDLKEHEAAFLKRQNLFFSIVAGSIAVVFCVGRNSFTIKISNLLLHLAAKWAIYRNLRSNLRKKRCSQRTSGHLQVMVSVICQKKYMTQQPDIRPLFLSILFFIELFNRPFFFFEAIWKYGFE